MMHMKRKTIILPLLLAAALLTGCTSAQSAGSSVQSMAAETAPVSGETAVSVETEQSEPIVAEEVISSGAETKSDETLITLSGGEGSVRITEAGTYRLTGTLSNGQIVVDAPEDAKVKLILDGVSINCEGSAAIYAVCADKLILSTAQGSSNLLESVGEFIQTDDNKVDACVFAKCDLNLNGDGTLGVRCESGHGVVSKDDLKVKDGTVSIEAANQCLSGNNSVTVEGGTLSIVSGTDGIRSSHDDPEKGFVELLGGSLYIQSGSEGVDASGYILLDGANLTVASGSKNNTESGKGLKADADITVNSGSLTVSSYDDAIHANGNVSINGGDLTIETADDGVHADGELLINDGDVAITQSYEGLEAQVITINGGSIRIVASDDGLNAAGGNDSSNAWGPRGGDPFASDRNAALSINGGTLQINAEGDGVDSNGSLSVTGGVVYVSGPTRGGNGALDYGADASITGGVLIAVGSADMAVNFGNSSTQGSILLSVGNQSAGAAVSVTDENGTALASFSPEKNYQSVVVSAPGMKTGGSYTVTAGTYSETITLNSLIYGSGMGFGVGPGQGGPGGRLGGRR